MDENLIWLCNWYYSQNNGDWKNQIEISTLDNPGLKLNVSLEQTSLLDYKFQELDIDRSENDWIYCVVKDKTFKGFGGPLNFPDILKNFRLWVESQSLYSHKENKTIKDENFLWILNWYQSQCDGFWEHSHGIHFNTLDNPGWHIRISLDETELQDQEFKSFEFKRNESDWLSCSIEESNFISTCGHENLIEVLKIFREWAELSQE